MTVTIDTSSELTGPSRARRLKARTRETHDRLDNRIMDAASFHSVAGYARFAAIQYCFHRDIDALYDDQRLRALLPDLDTRRRLALIRADLVDIGHDAVEPGELPLFSGGAVDLPTALGWLYVAEGSNLGAALLRKETAKLGLSDAFGARHLAPAPEGPAMHWRAFTAALDVVVLTPEEEDRVAAGAEAAFRRVQRYCDAQFG